MEEKQNISERFKNAMSYKLSFIDWIVYTIMFALISISVLFFTVMIMLMIWPEKKHDVSSSSNTTISSNEYGSSSNSSSDSDDISNSLYNHNKPIINSRIPNEYDIAIAKDYAVTVYGGGTINIDPSMIVLTYNGRAETLADALKLTDNTSTEGSSNPTIGGKCNIDGDTSSTSFSSQGTYFVSQLICSQGTWKELVPQ